MDRGDGTPANYKASLHPSFFYSDSTKVHTYTSITKVRLDHLFIMTLTGSCMCGAINYSAEGTDVLLESLELSILTAPSGQVPVGSLPLH